MRTHVHARHGAAHAGMTHAAGCAARHGTHPWLANTMGQSGSAGSATCGGSKTVREACFCAHADLDTHQRTQLARTTNVCRRPASVMVSPLDAVGTCAHAPRKKALRQLDGVQRRRRPAATYYGSNAAAARRMTTQARPTLLDNVDDCHTLWPPIRPACGLEPEASAGVAIALFGACARAWAITRARGRLQPARR